MYRIVTMRRISLAATLLAFCVVVFGAYVRLSDAGLGCPDWPGCYGHITPSAAAAANAGTAEAPLHVGKAWREMIHRYLASTLGLMCVVIAALALYWRRHPGVPLVLPIAFEKKAGITTLSTKEAPSLPRESLKRPASCGGTGPVSRLPRT